MSRARTVQATPWQPVPDMPSHLWRNDERGRRRVKSVAEVCQLLEHENARLRQHLERIRDFPEGYKNSLARRRMKEIAAEALL
jgi:hypothetical protein